MNCDRVRELLVDLSYGELDDSAEAAVRGHLARCEACRQEQEAIRQTRELLADHRKDEPGRVAALRPTWRRLLFVVVPAAVAAAAAIGVGLWWLLQGTSPVEVQAKELGPVEIKRVGVSLTILSKPAGWPERRRSTRPTSVVGRGQVLLPVQYESIGQHGWDGLALVRDRRIVRRLPKGRSRVRLTDVPAGILPDTVRLRGLDGADGMAILEQNYQYDLASASAVLRRHVGERITVTFKDAPAVAGRLLSFDDASLVIQPAGGGPRTIGRADVAAVMFAELPRGLLTRPTLVWNVRNDAAARQRFEVAYLTRGLRWRADYVLKVRPGRGPAAVDTADLVGYATVTNNSGVTYEDARLKLLAGDVNLIPPERETIYAGTRLMVAFDTRLGGVPQFRQKSFFEYHLYTLVRPTTLRDAETKQIEMLSAGGLRMKRAYVYDPQRDHWAGVRVVSEFKNSEANGLGKPMPKGVVRLYAPDAEGVQTHVSVANIDHTPVDEKIRFRWGHAFDLVGSFERTYSHVRGSHHDFTGEYRLRNHKRHDVTVTVVVHVHPTAYQATCNYPWHVREVGLVEIDVPVKAGTEAVVTFSRQEDHEAGGGLVSPHDGQEK